MPLPHAFIQNSEMVTDLFGSWPAFHDAEVLEVQLRRGSDVHDLSSPTLTMTIYAYSFGPEVGKVDVKLLFERVRDLELEDFNHQNCIYELFITEAPADTKKAARISVTMTTSFGLDLAFECERVAVLGITPHLPPEKGAP